MKDCDHDNFNNLSDILMILGGIVHKLKEGMSRTKTTAPRSHGYVVASPDSVR